MTNNPSSINVIICHAKLWKKIHSDDPEDNDEDSTVNVQEDSDEFYLPDDSDLEVDDDEFRRQLTS